MKSPSTTLITHIGNWRHIAFPGHYFCSREKAAASLYPNATADIPANPVLRKEQKACPGLYGTGFKTRFYKNLTYVPRQTIQGNFSDDTTLT